MPVFTAEQYHAVAQDATLREPAFGLLGTTFDKRVSTQEMLAYANLANWNVHLEEVKLDGRSDTAYFQTIRSNPFDGIPDVLGIVGERYVVFQNEELFQFGDNLLDGGEWFSAGQFKNGRVVFGTLVLDRETIIDPSGSHDVVRQFLLITTSHNGSIAIFAGVTPVRVWCQNSLSFAIRTAKQSFKIRHTQTADGKVMAAREALGLSHKYIDAWEAEMQKMIELELTREAVDDIFKTAFPMPDKDVKGSLKKWESKMDTIWDIYDGPTNANLADNAYKVEQTLIELSDWYRAPRKGNAESVLVGASGLDPIVNAHKNNIHKMVFDLATEKQLVTV